MIGRFVFVVLDGVGAGAQPDAGEYGDADANTLGNLARTVPLELPVLRALGLGNILPLPGVPPVRRPPCLVGRLRERSKGKDTTTGHWEHMGLLTERPFPTYPCGFPEEVLGPFRDAIGRGVLGNRPASGTQIIAELGEEHLRTGRPIVYTSADSVFQIACHLDVCPLDELYRYCRIARGILRNDHAVGRVIARPFRGPPGNFVRTPDRKDFSLSPTGTTYMDLLTERGVPVVTIGKIWQIFAGRGVTEEHKAASNEENLDKLEKLVDSGGHGLYFTNLVDFDTTWGHRNDAEGFARGLSEVDRRLPRLLERLRPEDRLLITADHGVDPTTPSTDHSREYVPMLYYPAPPTAPKRCYLGEFSDTGATAFHHLTGERPLLRGAPVQDLRPAEGWRSHPSLRWKDGGRTPWPTLLDENTRTAAVRVLQEYFGDSPVSAVILGSGLGGEAESLSEARSLDCRQIPGWRKSSVSGHAGHLVVGVRRGRRVAMLRGRLHPYEGFACDEVAFPVRVLAEWGASRLVVTNASGGLDPTLDPGTVTLLERVLDFQSMSPGRAPRTLMATDRHVLTRLRGRASWPEPVSYAAVRGPEYETEAEARMLRLLGARTVGMSTALEIEAARDEGMQTAGITVVTNMAGSIPDDAAEGGGRAWGAADPEAAEATGTPVGGGVDAHEEVLRRAEEARDSLARLLDEVLEIMEGTEPA